MATNRYKTFEGQRRRVINGNLRVMESVNQKLYTIEIQALNDITNRNNWRYTRLREHLDEFKDIPVLTAYLPNGKIGDGHNFDMKLDPNTGKEYASFTAPDAERIVGWVPKDANIRIENVDDTSWIVVTGNLWRWYAPELVEKIARQGRMSVSIETLVTKWHMDGDTEVEDEYVVLGITILGDGVSPAVSGANIQTLAALRREMQEQILRAASYAEPDSKQDNKQSKPNKTKGVNKMPITKKQLNDLTAKFEGFTCIGASADLRVMALINDNNEPFIYTAEDGDGGAIVTPRIHSASAEVKCFDADGNEATLSLEDAIADTFARLNSAVAESESKQATIDTLTTQLKAMQEAEKQRRLNAAEAAIDAKLNEYNENRPEGKRFNAGICDKLREAVKGGKYTDMVDADGKWIGDIAVCSEVSALCMEEQNRMDKENVKKYHSWTHNNSGNQSEEPRTIGERLMQ